jgi:PhnB protein
VASRLNPYLSFSGNARQAMEYYQGVFGGNLTVNTFGEFGAADSPIANQVMHAMLETDAGYTIMGSDTPPEMARTPGDTVTVSISGDDTEALRGYWDKLADGGSVSTPLEKQMWGDEFGQCTDQFGVHWMIDIIPPRA